MKYMLLIHQGDTPTPRDPEAWGKLSEDEQKAVYADYMAINQTDGREPRAPARRARDRHHGARRGRQDADHRRPVRRRSRRRSAASSSSRPMTSTLRSSWPRVFRRRAWVAPSRCARWWSASDSRAGLPRPVGPCPGHPDRLPRRLRPRRGSHAGGLCGRCRALAEGRDPIEPGRLAHNDGAQPGDRPDPPRSHPGREDEVARGSRGGGGQRGRRRHSRTSGSSSSSPAATRRWPRTRRWRSRCGPLAASPPPRSRARSWCPRRRWRSAW